MGEAVPAHHLVRAGHPALARPARATRISKGRLARPPPRPPKPTPPRRALPARGQAPRQALGPGRDRALHPGHHLASAFRPAARFCDLGPDYHTNRVVTHRRLRSHIAQLTAIGYGALLNPPPNSNTRVSHRHPAPQAPPGSRRLPTHPGYFPVSQREGHSLGYSIPYDRG